MRDSQDVTISTLEGSFDIETDEITAVVPAASLTPAITDGSTFDGFETIAWRLVGVLLIRADDAIGLCPYTVGGEGGDEEPEPNEPPTASAGISPERPRVGEEVTFDGSGSSDADGDSLTYRWDFGDGHQANGEIVTHAYAKAGKYTVTLTVRDGNGGVSRDRQTLQVRGRGRD